MRLPSVRVRSRIGVTRTVLKTRLHRDSPVSSGVDHRYDSSVEIRAENETPFSFSKIVKSVRAPQRAASGQVHAC